MRRSICFCEPNYALAGQTGHWKFILTTAQALSKGAKVKFDLQSLGRADIDWTPPSVSSRASKNVIYAYLPDGKPIWGKEVEVPGRLVPQYEFVLPGPLESGENLTIAIGCKPGKEDQVDSQGNRVQTNSQRRRNFLLYIDPKGKGNYEEPEVFMMDVRGNKLSNIKVLAPSYVARNKRFDVMLRFEDEHGNLTANAPEDTLVELTYEHLRENLNWKLFVPETGFITLPNMYFNEPGIYKIQLQNLKTREKFYSPPILCSKENDMQILWGLLHGESDRVDSGEDIESCLRHLRDEQLINFFASSCFESIEETPPEIWKLVSSHIGEFNEKERFATLLGFQWSGEAKEEGLRHFLFSKDAKNLFRKKDSKSSSLKKIYRSSSPKDLLSIPSFTMGGDFGWNFDDWNPEFEKVVEIYNAWGSSECSEAEGNPLPIHSPNGSGLKQLKEGSIREALNRNIRVGFVGGGLDDRGIFSELFESDQFQYSPGLTAVLAEEHSREGLLEALHQRSCYATTGERIMLSFAIAGTPMGKEISTGDKPGLKVNRHIQGLVAGTGPLKSIEIIRNGKLHHTVDGEGKSQVEFTHDDMDALEKVALKDAESGLPFTYYYIRVNQEDGHMAWSSPIWVDLSEEKTAPTPAKRGRKTAK